MTEDEVLQILKLIEESSFDYLELETEDLKLTVRKSGYGDSDSDSPAPSVLARSSTSERPTTPTQVREPEGQAEVEPSRAKSTDAGVRAGTIPIKAPMVGTFYIAPEPGAAPFIDVGGYIDEDTTVGLIEVMKVFTSVRSEVKGVIAEICVQNGQFVEYGQTLFLVSPAAAGAKKVESG